MVRNDIPKAKYKIVVAKINILGQNIAKENIYIIGLWAETIFNHTQYLSGLDLIPKLCENI